MNSGLIIAPNGFPAEKRRETLSKEEIELVQKFETWCHRRKISLDLICNECIDAGHGRGSRIAGNNRRDSMVYKMECAHASRVYGQ